MREGACSSYLEIVDSLYVHNQSSIFPVQDPVHVIQLDSILAELHVSINECYVS